MDVFTGILYTEFMRTMAQVLKPSSYFEIGTHAGGSLAHFPCDAVCVDPNFQFDRDVMPNRRKTFLFQMTSDEFFAENNLFTFFPQGVDIAFLDGLHKFEFLLRDFINTERYCHNRSIILLHDCLPFNLEITSRVYRGGAWTGDVCRILPILKKYRPDLRIRFLDCPPTGLVACTNLDPRSNVLSERYHEIVDEAFESNLTEPAIWDFRTLFPTFSSRQATEFPEDLTALFAASPKPIL